MSKKKEPRTIEEIKKKIDEDFKKIFPNKTIEDVINKMNLVRTLTPTEKILATCIHTLQGQSDKMKAKLKTYMSATLLFSETLTNFMALYNKEMTEVQRKLEINKLKEKLDEGIKQVYDRG